MDAMMHPIKTDKIGRFIILKTPRTMFSINLFMRPNRANFKIGSGGRRIAPLLKRESRWKYFPVPSHFSTTIKNHRESKSPNILIARHLTRYFR